MIKTLNALLNKPLTRLRIDLLPIPMHPPLNTINPTINGEPQITIRQEILRQLRHLRIVSQLLLEEVLTTIVLLCIVEGGGQGLVY
jgi:hypothetical protein